MDEQVTKTDGTMPTSKKIDGNPFSGDMAKALDEWWKSLENKKGLRASLRRVTIPNAVFFERELYSLLSSLRKHNASINDTGLAAVMGLLSHVKTPLEGQTFGGILGKLDGTGKPLLSEARFKRLIVVESRDEVYRDMIRILRHSKGQAPIANLANVVYWWNEKAKRRFAQDYYRAVTTAGDDKTNETEPNETEIPNGLV
jgi:CRISPR system Cascade subunit CasB